MFRALLDADGAARMTGRASSGIVVIGLGNSYRGDDGVGVAAAAELHRLALPNVRVVTDVVDPMSLLEAWSGAGLAVVIDGAVGTPPTPGRVRRCNLSDVETAREGLSSHSVDVGRTHELGQALGRVPDELVLFTVEVADTGHGIGLTPRVARAVPEVVRMAAAEIDCNQTPTGVQVDLQSGQARSAFPSSGGPNRNRRPVTVSGITRT